MFTREASRVNIMKKSAGFHSVYMLHGTLFADNFRTVDSIVMKFGRVT